MISLTIVTVIEYSDVTDCRVGKRQRQSAIPSLEGKGGGRGQAFLWRGVRSTHLGANWWCLGEGGGLDREGRGDVQTRKPELRVQTCPSRAQHAATAALTRSGSASWVPCF